MLGHSFLPQDIVIRTNDVINRNIIVLIVNLTLNLVMIQSNETESVKCSSCLLLRCKISLMTCLTLNETRLLVLMNDQAAI